MKHLILLVSFLSATASMQGSLTIIEDFSDVSDWTINGNSANTLTVDSTTFAGESVGAYTVNNGTLTSYHKGLGGNSIADGTTGTVFFQMYVPDQVSNIQDTSHWLGTSAAAAPGAFGPNNTYVGTFDEVDNSTVNFLARDGNTGSTDLDDFSVDQWYNVWMVIDNSANTYDVYVNQGTSAAVAGDLVANDLDFRTNTTADGDQITVSLFGATTGSVVAGRTVFFDNIYVDSNSSTLANPVPEPSTYALIAGFLTLGAVLIRRRLNS
jgi:hypothetical protein